MDRQAVQERFGIIGKAAGLLHAIDRTRLVARTEVTVLIEGESGTGKELIAHAIHGLSQRRHGTFQVINMGAIPEGLIEAELFGAEKGAYTNAVERRIGYFEKANHGTIFLDEIGEMPPAAQVRLLRVLESGSFNRVGSSTMRNTDARVVAATNKDLGGEVKAGRFREDLYYRISTVIIRLPPLRERQEDILPLFHQFLHEFSRKYNSTRRRLTDNAVALLERYHWPGNIRELRNAAEAATITNTREMVTAAMLRPLLRGVSKQQSTALVPVTHAQEMEPGTFNERALIYRALVSQQASLGELHREVHKLRTGLEELTAHLQGSGSVVQLETPGPKVPLLPAHEDGDGFIAYEEAPEPEDPTPAVEPIPTIIDAERLLIARALDHYGGNRRNAAKALGISERSLYRRIKNAEGANN